MLLLANQMMQILLEYKISFLLYGTHAVMSLKVNPARTVDNKSL